ncbi:MAG TPA: glycosyltransferase family 4 protein [Thermoanaerobaculia bacterium]|nr:glycosyltransferase family 4 protein [Thermoanaerobaculia bacterium]
MILLASKVAPRSPAARHGHGGIEILNRLVLDATGRARLAGVAISFADTGNGWGGDGLRAVAAGGSRVRFSLAAMRHLRAARNSTVLATHADLAPVARLASLLGRGRLVCFLHGVEVWRRLPARTRWGLAGADRLVAISAFTLNTFRTIHPRLSEIDAIVCHLPARRLDINTRRLAELRGGNRPRVLVVGRLWGRGMRKGQRQLIELWPRLLRRFPGAELWIVGDGAGRAELEELARNAGVAREVRLTGGVSDGELAALYASSDVYAMPSEGEGFGLVFAEAMAAGLPCIASKLDAGREVVADEETGILVDPRDAEEIHSALVTLLADPLLRSRMGEAGRWRAERLFSLRAFDSRIAEILDGA